MKRTTTLALAVTAGLTLAMSSHAVMYPPYIADGDTLHLWHMDSTSAPEPDAGTTQLPLNGLLNSATLGNASYPGFGTALNTTDDGQNATAAGSRNAMFSAANPVANVSVTYADSASGAFTMEAIVRIGFDPTISYATAAAGGNGRNSPFMIIGGDSATTGNRLFQFRIAPIGVAGATATTGPLLTFENIRMVSGNQPTIYAAIPMDGPNGIVSNEWYHVAVTYDGVPSTTDNLKFYWTRLDPTLAQANQIAITSPTATLTGMNPLSTGSTPFMIGNLGRQTSSQYVNNFVGLIDEVRISRVARSEFGMLFGPPEISVVKSPVDDTVAVGQPASFSVSAAGLPPYSYQWRLNETVIPDATNSSYAIRAAQAGDAGNYDVVITNASSSITSEVATLTVRTPANLTWVGFGGDWDAANVLWDSNNDTAPDAAYAEGDNVLFNGLGDYLVFLAKVMHPSSVTVNSGTDYFLTTDKGGALDRNMHLIKSGTSTLTIETLNSYTGGTDIQQGTLQVGSSIGVGSIGTGSVTNNGSLVLSNGIVATPFITGTGDVTVNIGTTLSLQTNSLAGALTMNGGTVTMSRPEAQGNHSSITLNATANPGPSLSLAGAFFPATRSISLLGTTASPDTRCTLTFTSGTNSFEGPINLGGDGTVQLFSNPNTWLDLPAITSPGFTGKLLLRGSGTNNFVHGAITVGMQVSVADASVWTFEAANSWLYGEAAQNSTFRIAAVGALPPSGAFNVFGGTLDMAGYNAQVAHINSTNTSTPFAENLAGVIGNSSSTSDSVFTVNSSATDNVLSAAINDSVRGGTRKTSLTLAGGGTLILANPTNGYTGDTLITGTLALSNNATINNSANIVLSSGSTLSAALRVGSSLTLTPAQTLKGDSLINIIGNLTNQGAIELKVNKTGDALSGDRVQGMTSMNYGGTLKLVLSGQALTAGNSIKLFDAGSHTGAFAAITPSTPGEGLSWNTSELATSGTLSVATGPDPTPTDINFTVVGNGTVELQWPSSHTGWILQAQTNSTAVGLANNWMPVSGSSSTNRLFVPIDPAQGAVFYRMLLP